MFTGREKESEALQAVLKKKSGSVLVYGKRKIGKTTLILRTLKDDPNKTVYYECLKAPLQENIDGFVTALADAHVLPVKMGFGSFGDVFRYIDSLGQTLNIVIDEYPYLKQFAKSETVDSVSKASSTEWSIYACL